MTSSTWENFDEITNEQLELTLQRFKKNSNNNAFADIFIEWNGVKCYVNVDSKMLTKETTKYKLRRTTINLEEQFKKFVLKSSTNSNNDEDEDEGNFSFRSVF